MPSLLGSAPDQVPTNGDLGDMAYQTREHVTVEKISTPDGDLQAQIDALTSALNALTDETAMVLLETKTASNSASIDFTDIDGTYSSYELRLIAVKPVDTSANLAVRISTDNGATFITTSTYNMTYLTSSATGSNTQTLGNSGFTVWNTTDAPGFNGELKMQNVDDASKNQLLRFIAGLGIDSATPTIGQTVIEMDSPSILNAIRILFNSGNIASGTFKLYGIK